LFWFPAWGDAAPPYIVSLWIFAALIPAAIVMLWRERHPFVWFALAVYAAYPALYYLIQASVLYTLPIVWLHVMCAGYVAASAPTIGRLLSESADETSGP
jgi:hypothetical protein